MSYELGRIKIILNAYNTTLKNLAELCRIAAMSEARIIPIERIVDELQTAYNNINNIYDTEIKRMKESVSSDN